MTLLYDDGFQEKSVKSSSYEKHFNLRPQPWWRRLLGLKRPAGRVYLHMNLSFGKGGWRTLEIVSRYPEGVDAVVVKFRVLLDGTTILVDPSTCIVSDMGE